MFDSILTNLQTDAVNLSEWWQAINTSYRAGGCLLLSLLMMWEATKAHEENDRKFFLSGLAALGLLAYGAVLFVQSIGNARQLFTVAHSTGGLAFQGSKCPSIMHETGF